MFQTVRAVSKRVCYCILPWAVKSNKKTIVCFPSDNRYLGSFLLHYYFIGFPRRAYRRRPASACKRVHTRAYACIRVHTRASVCVLAYAGGVRAREKSNNPIFSPLSLGFYGGKSHIVFISDITFSDISRAACAVGDRGRTQLPDRPHVHCPSRNSYHV